MAGPTAVLSLALGITFRVVLLEQLGSGASESREQVQRILEQTLPRAMGSFIGEDGWEYGVRVTHRVDSVTLPRSAASSLEAVIDAGTAGGAAGCRAVDAAAFEEALQASLSPGLTDGAEDGADVTLLVLPDDWHSPAADPSPGGCYCFAGREADDGDRCEISFSGVRHPVLDLRAAGAAADAGAASRASSRDAYNDVDWDDGAESDAFSASDLASIAEAASALLHESMVAAVSRPAVAPAAQRPAQEGRAMPVVVPLIHVGGDAQPSAASSARRSAVARTLQGALREVAPPGTEIACVSLQHSAGELPGFGIAMQRALRPAPPDGLRASPAVAIDAASALAHVRLDADHVLGDVLERTGAAELAPVYVIGEGALDFLSAAEWEALRFSNGRRDASSDGAGVVIDAGGGGLGAACLAAALRAALGVSLPSDALAYPPAPSQLRRLADATLRAHLAALSLSSQEMLQDALRDTHAAMDAAGPRPAGGRAGAAALPAEAPAGGDGPLAAAEESLRALRGDRTPRAEWLRSAAEEPRAVLQLVRRLEDAVEDARRVARAGTLPEAHAGAQALRGKLAGVRAEARELARQLRQRRRRKAETGEDCCREWAMVAPGA